MIGSFFPLPVHCANANAIVCAVALFMALFGPQKGRPLGALHLLLIRATAPQPQSRLSNLAALLSQMEKGWPGCGERGLGSGVPLSAPLCCSGDRGGSWGVEEKRGRKRRRGAIYQTPRHQAFGLNHNTANYLLLTRKNERGARMKKNRIVRER